MAIIETAVALPTTLAGISVTFRAARTFDQAGATQAIALNQDGSVNSVSPLSVATGVSVTIGGAEAKVLFGGVIPGFVGLMQVNVEILQGSTTGNAAVELTMAGRKTPSPAPTIAVR